MPGVHFRTLEKDPETGEDSAGLALVRLPRSTCWPTRRDGENREWGRYLAIHDGDGKVHHFAMPMAMMAGDGAEYRRELLRHGFVLAPGKTAREQLDIYLSMWRPKRRVRCVDRIGWHGPRFVLPDRTFGPGGETVVLQAEQAGEVHGRRQPRGLEAARGGPGRRQQPPRLRPFRQLRRAAAAPRRGQESGGFHFKGGSSIGKTSALHAARSTWGCALGSWRTTDNAAEATAAGACDTLHLLDEVSQADAPRGRRHGLHARQRHREEPRHPHRRGARGRDLAHPVPEHRRAEPRRQDRRGRQARPRRPVGARDRHPGRRRQGPGPVRHAARLRQRRRAGRPPAPVRRGPLGARRPRVPGADHRGPGRHRRDPARVHGDLAGGARCQPQADGQVGRVAARFALVAAAGELATALGILPWPEGEASAAAARCFNDWLAARGDSGPEEIASGIRQVRAFLELHGSSRFEEAWPRTHAADISRDASWPSTNASTGPGSGAWSTRAGRELGVLRPARGVARRGLRRLRRRGHRQGDDRQGLDASPARASTSPARSGCPASGKPRLYCITSSFLAGDEP